MKTVYVVTSGCYSNYGIDGIFSTKELAQEYIDWVESLSEYCDFNEVEEYGLDELRKAETCTIVGMGRDGAVISISQCAQINPYSGFKCFSSWGSPHLVWWVKTEDKERAVKVVNEKRAIILANNEWDNHAAVRERFGK